MSVPHTVLHLLEIMQSLLLLSSGPPFPSLWSAATTLPSARENPASLSALSLIWFLGSGPALVRTTASEPSAVLVAAFPFSHLQPQPASPHLVRSACVLSPSALKQVMGAGEEEWVRLPLEAQT